MKPIIKPILILLLFACIISCNLKAQEFKQAVVNFDLIGSKVFNDTILFHKLRVEGTTNEGASIVGTISLSLCSCYCDSLWDAWPDCYPNCFQGNGTLGYIEPSTSFSSSGGGTISGLKGRGSLGIKQMEGGKLREEEFLLPVKYNLEIK